MAENTSSTTPAPSVSGKTKRSIWGKIRHTIATAVSPKTRMRFKALTRMGGYLPLFSLPTLTIGQKWSLFQRFMKIDWNILHGHRPGEIAFISEGMAKRRARPKEIMVEAGCWNGGSSAKFSILCKLLGYELHIYDSFQGVEPIKNEAYDHWYDFSGEYAAPEELVRSNIEKYGEIDICHFHKGWFSETMKPGMIDYPVHISYIDCDLSKGTREALEGIAPRLTGDAIIFSQDYHIEPVKELLDNPETWKKLGCRLEKIQFGHHHTASFRVKKIE